MPDTNPDSAPNLAEPAPARDPRRINASPTKDFFIYMITRDIPLTRAVLDLVDNSVDGARMLRPAGDYNGLWIRLEVSSHQFRIADNCGGIPVDIARNYAFRFGRPSDAPLTPGSVGQFGVGMKRAFFKLGYHFNVTSTTETSRFVVDVDVNEWKTSARDADTDNWHFAFDELNEGAQDIPADSIGTIAQVDDLHPSVAESFGLDSFIIKLKQEIATAHAVSLDRGLIISVNTIPLTHDPQHLFVSEDIQPACIVRQYPPEPEPGAPPVKVKILAGIGERSLHDAGWSLFCNGRLVLRADQTAQTVWGQAHNMRQYHPDFAFFRGYAYFDSDNAALLPWTTTKTGVDTDSQLYRAAQQLMIEATKPVLIFLSALAREKAQFDNGEISALPLQNALRAAHEKAVDEVPALDTFRAPTPPPPPSGPPMQRIQYSKPADDVEKAKRLLGVTTFTAVGERTFDYFMGYEGD